MTRHSRPLALALLGAAVALGGCDEGIERVDSNDILLTPNHDGQLVFPRTRVGRKSVPEVIEIAHGGITPLIIRDVRIEGYEECDLVKHGLGPGADLPAEVDGQCQFIIVERPADQEPENDRVLFRLESGAKAQVSVVYRPIEGQPVPPPARLVITSNVRDKETQWIDLAVQTAAPQVVLDPPVISFAGGAGQTKFMFVKNSGTGELLVNNFSVTLKTPAAVDPNTQQPVEEFRVDADRSLPWAIAEGDAVTVTVTYNPVDDVADEAELVFENNDQANPRATATLTSKQIFGMLTVEPNPVVFEVPSAGGSSEEILNFTNTGLAAVNVNKIELVQPGEDYGPQPQTFVLQGGASRQVPISYRPLTREGSDAEVRVEWVDAGDPNAATRVTTVVLRREGQQLPPFIEVAPSTANMSSVAPGSTGEETITISNVGDAPVEITRIAFSGPGDEGVMASDPEFRVKSGGGATTLAPGRDHDVVVEFVRPADDRVAHFGALIIESSAISSPDIVYFTADAP